MFLRILFLCGFVFGGWSAAHAQGSLDIYADSAVVKMTSRFVGFGKAKEVPGFRIQVMASPDRAGVMKRKADFLAAFPDIRLDYEYREPYHRLRAGAFPSKEAAQKWMDEHAFKRSFPEAIAVYDEHVRMKDMLDTLGFGEEEK